jgi:hypothetical protein
MNDPPVLPGSEASQARKFRFVAELPADEQVADIFVHPDRRYAIAEQMAVVELLEAPQGSNPNDDELLLILLRTSAGNLEMQRHAEAWVHGSAPTAIPTNIELQLRSERILWRPGYAVLIGSAERCEEILPGLVRFAFFEGELRKLERELDGEWQTAQSDVDLTHGVDRCHLLRRRHVDAMTSKTALRRIRFARLVPCLHKPSPTLAGSARRVAGELALQAEVLERLGHVDDRLEVFEDLYELANDRLNEFSYFSREFSLELWIVLLLLAELIVMIADLWVSSRSVGH